MSNRHGDWLRQAEADLRHARSSVDAGHHEWSCFAAFDAGAPTDYYTAAEAQAAIVDAATVLEYCRRAVG
jgi:HEPN domain-containing protein